MEQGSPTKLILTAVGLEISSYTLVLESFDNNSSVKSVLRTDTLTIKIVAGASVKECECQVSVSRARII